MAVREPPVALIVFGAGSATGAAVVEAFRRRTGRPVIAVRRRPPSTPDGHGVRGVVCDALDRAAVGALFDDAPADAAVVTVLGGKPGDAVPVDDIGNRNVIDAAGAQRHVVLVTSLGCGDTAELVSPRLRQAIGGILDAKTRAEDHLRRANGRFTILRPGGLMEGERTGTAELSETSTASGMIIRADLAELVVDVLLDTAHRGRVYGAIDPHLRPPPRTSGHSDPAT